MFLSRSPSSSYTRPVSCERSSSSKGDDQFEFSATKRPKRPTWSEGSQLPIQKHENHKRQSSLQLSSAAAFVPFLRSRKVSISSEVSSSSSATSTSGWTKFSNMMDSPLSPFPSSGSGKNSKLRMLRRRKSTDSMDFECRGEDLDYHSDLSGGWEDGNRGLPGTPSLEGYGHKTRKLLGVDGAGYFTNSDRSSGESFNSINSNNFSSSQPQSGYSSNRTSGESFDGTSPGLNIIKSFNEHHFNRAPRSHSQEPQNIRPSTASGKMSIAGHFVRRSESAISINPVRPSTASGTSAAKFNAFSHAYAPSRSFTSVPTNEVAEDVLVTRSSEHPRTQRSSSFNAFSHAAPKRPPRPERGLSILYSDDQTIIPPTTEQVDLKENSEAPVSNDLPPSSPVEPFNAFAHTSKRRSRPNSAEHNVTVVPPTPGAETNVVEEPEPTAELVKAPTPPPAGPFNPFAHAPRRPCPKRPSQASLASSSPPAPQAELQSEKSDVVAAPVPIPPPVTEPFNAFSHLRRSSRPEKTPSPPPPAAPAEKVAKEEGQRMEIFNVSWINTPAAAPAPAKVKPPVDRSCKPTVAPQAEAEAVAVDQVEEPVVAVVKVEEEEKVEEKVPHVREQGIFNMTWKTKLEEMKNGMLSDAPPFITSTDGTPTPETSATLVGSGTDTTPPFDLELEEEETLVFDGRAFVKQN